MTAVLLVLLALAVWAAGYWWWQARIWAARYDRSLDSHLQSEQEHNRWLRMIESLNWYDAFGPGSRRCRPERRA